MDNSKVFHNIFDTLRVLYDELSSDANSDIKEKSKALLKTLNSQL